jgi:hypothetical protein
MKGSHQAIRDSLAKVYGYPPLRFIHATKKGVPVSRLCGSRQRKVTSAHAGKPGGVSSGSHILQHYYRDERAPGSGAAQRRLIRRKERRMWQNELEMD